MRGRLLEGGKVLWDIRATLKHGVYLVQTTPVGYYAPPLHSGFWADLKRAGMSFNVFSYRNKLLACPSRPMTPTVVAKSRGTMVTSGDSPSMAYRTWIRDFFQSEYLVCCRVRAFISCVLGVNAYAAMRSLSSTSGLKQRTRCVRFY